MPDDIVVASTTDSFEDVQRAAGAQEAENQPNSGGEGRDEQDGVQAEGQNESESETDKGEEEQREEASHEEGDEGTQVEGQKPKPKSKNNLQDRFDELTRTIKEQNEKIAALEGNKSPKAGEEEAGDGEEQEPEETERTASGELRPKPTMNDVNPDGTPKYKDLGEFTDDLTDWKLDYREAVKAKNSRDSKIIGAYNDGVTKFKATNPDFDAVVGQKGLVIPKAVQVAIVEAGADGPELAYYLAKNPEVRKQMETLSPASSVRLLGRIEAQIKAKNQPTSPEKGNEKPTVVNKTQSSNSQKKTVTTPITHPTANDRPIEPSRGTARSAVKDDELPYQDYKKKRNAEEAARRGR